MSVRWTDEQQEVLKAQGNITVSAAAGSGKTAVLTERIVQLAASGTALDEMLVVTFTKAAAAEMKQRIEKSLYERSELAQDGALRRFLYEQANAVSRANISTLHSFCAYILRRHFYEAGLSPTFRVGDAAELSSLLDEAVNEALSDLYSCDECARELPAMFLGENNLIDAVYEILEKMRSRSDGDKWLSQAVQNYNLSAFELKQSPIVQEHLDYVREKIHMAYIYSCKCAHYTSNEKLDEVVSERTEFLEKVLDECKTYDDFYNALCTPLRNFRGTKGSTDELKKYKKQVDDCYKAAQDMIPDLDYAAEQQKKAYPYMQLTEKLVHAINDIYTEKKQKKSIIDFSDLELLTLKVLENNSISDIYKKRFKYIFVDEYQDINPLQDDIIKHLLSDENAFFVGDVKQSIYRFRNAKPALFINKMKSYEKAEGSQTLMLSANFRSSDAVINFVNAIFTTLMTKHTCGIDYAKQNMLVKMGAAGKGNVRIHFIESQSQQDSDDEDLDEMLSENAQAKATAEEIKRMLNQTFYDTQNRVVRNFRYSDFAVIMRSVKSNGEAFVRELLLEGIPVYVEASDGYFDAIEVRVFINLLSIIDNRRQDIPLLSVMRSVIGNFSIEEITSMRITANTEAVDGKSFDMLDVLNFSAQACGNEKAKSFLDKLNEWQNFSQFSSLSEFVQMLLTDTGYYIFAEALPGGKHRAANLDRFKAITAAYESNVNKGLHDFLKYLADANDKIDIGSSQEAAANAVSIITMHKSKGLEYNAVIIPAMQRKIAPSASNRSKLIFDDMPIIGAKLLFGSRDNENLYYSILSNKEKRALYADELRLLYVAFTRARDTLILISTVSNTGEVLSDNNITDSDMSELNVLHSAKNYTDWIASALWASEYRNLCFELVESGVAKNEELYMDSTPICMYRIPECDVDRSYFEAELDKLKAIDTESVDAEMNWKYPYESAVKLTSKGSVTGFAASQTVLSYRSGDTATDMVSAVQRGTATHTVFERLPLCEHNEKSVRAFINSLEAEGILSHEEALSLNIKGIAAFFKRPLYERILQSETVLKEQEFSCMVEAWRLIEGNTSDELIMVQGIIDCCFKENGKWIILDYKTDRVNGNDPDSVIKQAYTHKKQLALYAHVLKKITGIDVAECYICFVNAYDVRVEI